MKLPVTLLVLTSLSLAQTAPLPGPGAPPPPSIRTTGEFTVTAQPDRAILDVGVITQAPTAQTAATENARRLEAVMRQLKQAAGAVADLKTLGYSLDPDYRYPKEGGQPQIAGYTARNTIQVTTPDLTGVGRLIDAATQAGANTVQRLQYVLKDEQAARAQALGQAAKMARSNAEAIASALGLRILRVLRVEEGGEPGVRPVEARLLAPAAALAPSTPVAPGAIEVHGSVILTVEIGL